MPRTTKPSDVGVARRAFFELGRQPVGQISETILESWQRCQRMGLEFDTRPTVAPVTQTQLREIRERNELLWRLARAELEALAAETDATGSIVLLTDHQGWILDAEGNSGFLDKAGRVALMPGACWSESAVGTNAVGTAIVEGVPVSVHGGEHYFSPNRILTCSASPIYDPFGDLVGVLDISGDSSVPHTHALGLAKLAVANIEHRFFDEGIPGCELLRLHLDPALLGTAREGLLAFRDGRLLAANQAALSLFGLDRNELGEVRYQRLFEDGLSKLRDQGMIVDQHGRVLHGRVDERDDRGPRRRPTKPAIVVSGAADLDNADQPLFDSDTELLLQRARRVADAGLPVLVQGETGSGKEVFARELHRRSARADKPFVAVNCAALPEGLIEAELFGYEEGAFTGARRSGRTGLLRQADGGVLFLDEIGDMPLALQPRLLRVLQDRELSPLGGGKPVKLDFVLICATHRELEGCIADGRFRPDLYYRISHHCVRIPSVREQQERTPLVSALWDRIAQGRRLSADALAALAGHEWPGNLRQLAACLRTLVALSEPGEIIERDALPGYVHGVRQASAAAPITLARDAGLDAMTEAAMRDALAACDGNVAHAARRLGISRSTLYRRLGGDLRAGGRADPTATN